MTKALITTAFFEPIFSGEGPVKVDHRMWRFRHNCDVQGLMVRAMDRAREAGLLQPIAHTECRDFEEAHAYNRLQAAGSADLPNGDRFLATQLLHQHLVDMIVTLLSKHIDWDGALDDEAALRADLPKLVRRVNAFLKEPKIHTRKGYWPRGTRFHDRALMETSRTHVAYMVAFNGWTPTLYECMDEAWWTKAEALDAPRA